MIDTIEIAWAAGFLEGEGSFNTKGGSALVTAAQVQKQPLERLVALFGGKLTQRITKGFSSKPIWVWCLPAKRSIQVMMTLYVLMSPKRREEIKKRIAKWKTARLVKDKFSEFCIKGHQISGYNALKTSEKHYTCRICKNARRQLWRKRRKAAGLPKC